ncbi:MAG: hypothetical protein GY795_16555 [Desulfobacterales bacterium]|nr:hypothetical protein [Desulfobacterales bacterium]
MKLKTVDDRSVMIFLSISLPSFLLLVMGIILIAMVIDQISYDEAFEALQLTLPIIITYIGAIVGFSFTTSGQILFPKKHKKKKSQDDIRNLIRPLISLILTIGLMSFMLILTLLIIFDLITFKEFKTWISAITWALTGLVSFIIGRYFGKEIKLAKIENVKVS